MPAIRDTIITALKKYSFNIFSESEKYPIKWIVMNFMKNQMLTTAVKMRKLIMGE